MTSIISAELYKFWKRKLYLAILVLCSFSLIYALAIYFRWSFVTITGRLDLITFVTTMWTLIMILGFPLILFSYLGASILGGEIYDGQILLQVNRVHSKNSLIIGKTIALSISLICSYALNFILSIIFYILFVAQSTKGYIGWHFESYSLRMIEVNLLGVLLLLFIISSAMFFSVNFGVFRATIFSIIIFIVLKFIVNIPLIDKWVPGYYTMVDNYNSSSTIMIYQLLILILLASLMTLWTCKIFVKKQY